MRNWLIAIESKLEDLAGYLLPSEYHFVGVTYCDGHSVQSCTLSDLFLQYQYLVDKLDQYHNSENGQGNVAQEIVTLFALVANAQRFDVSAYTSTLENFRECDR